MNHKITTRNGIMYAFLPALILLFIAGVAYSHKDKPHTEVDSSLVNASDTTSDSALIVRDSVYAIIQEGYQGFEPLFKRACYDCHSDQTVYPWYYKLPLVKGLMDDDISEAREHLDMSKGFPFAGHGTPYQDLEAMKKDLQEGEMPPFKYWILHSSAEFSTKELDSIITWIDQSLELITASHLAPTESNDTEPTHEE